MATLPLASLVDMLAHAILFAGKLTIGLVLLPYNFIATFIKIKQLPRDLTLTSASVHLIALIEGIIHSFTLGIVVLASPKAADKMTQFSLRSAGPRLMDNISKAKKKNKTSESSGEISSDSSKEILCKEKMIGGTKLKILVRDITKAHVDAIVNAANEKLLGGSGVDAAIHREGGPAILRECQIIREQEKYKKGCTPGDAVITAGGKLPAKHVIHAVGPRWNGGNDPATEAYAKSLEEKGAILKAAYTRSLELASENGIKSIAFPAISTGVFGFPKDLASAIALAAVRDYVKEHQEIEEVQFVFLTEKEYQYCEKPFDQIIP